MLEQHGLRPRKRLGQHFLADPNIVDRIVRLAGVGADDLVIEVGAGTGTLTRALAATGATVRAYEIDPSLRPVLEESVGHAPNVTVQFKDATTADLAADLDGGPWVLVANLPYNVGTPLILDLLRAAPEIVRHVVMVQREVADRLTAGPGSRTYGLPSVTVGLYANVERAFTVPPQVFVPPPDVESAVVVLDRIAPSPHAASAEALAQGAFGQRRKMLRRSLTTVVTDPEAMLERAGIDPTARAEDLSVDDYLTLAAAIA
jgi:16S rRNA (adenine1518-N6/adenine1519-N6)-dimethyltransferase